MKRKLLDLMKVATLGLVLGMSSVSVAQTGAALNFDGTNDYVNLGTVISPSLNNSPVLTVESWVRPTANTGTASIISNHFGGTQFALRQLGSQYQFMLGFGTYALLSAANTVTLNTWQHVAAVFNNTVMSIYINGALSSQTTIPAYSLAASSNSVWIGNDGFSELFTGDIDETRIWKRALCQSEIQNNKNGELPAGQVALIAYYQYNQGTAGGSNPTFTTVPDAGPAAVTGTLMNFALTGPTSNWVTPGGVTSGSLAPVYYGGTVTVNSGSINPGQIFTMTPSGAPSYTFSSGSSTVSPNVLSTYTVYGYAGGCLNKAVSTVSVNANALNFDGVNDCVNLGTTISNSLSNSNVLTVESWVRPTVLTGTAAIVDNHFGGTQFALRRVQNQFNFFIGFGTYGVNSPVGTASLNTWQHVAAVFNNTVLSLYINGALITTTTFPSYSLAVSSNSVWIGNDGFSEPHTGDIDETRIWKRALCQTEIQNNMNGELTMPQLGLLAYYKYNEGSSGANNAGITTLTDAGPNNITGTLTNIALSGTTSNWIAPAGISYGATAPVFTIGGFSVAGSNSICIGSSATFTASGVTSYSWSTGALTATALVSPTVNTTYSVVGTTSVGCQAQLLQSLTVVALPSVSASANANSICTGSSATLTASGASTYSWSNGAVTAATAVSPTMNATYTVTGTSSVGCVNTATTGVNVNPNPTVTAVTTETNMLCSGQSATLTASGASTFVWNTTATTAVIVISPTVTTTYTVTGTDVNGCQNIATVTQNVSNCTGIAVNQKDQLFNIYPNPTSGNFTMELAADASVKISDLSGRMIYSSEVEKGNYRFDLSNYQNGIYLVTVRQNEQVRVYKLTKQ